MVMGLDNASVVDHRVDNGSAVDNWIDRSGVVHRVDSGEWGMSESGVRNGIDDSSSVEHRVDSGKWGVSESGVDKRGISFSLSLVNHVGKSGMASNARGSVADSWDNIFDSWDRSLVGRNNRSGDSWDDIPVQRATIGVRADHSTVVDRVDSSAVHGGGVESGVEKSGISFSFSLLNFVDNFSILGNIRRLSQSLSKGSGFGSVVLRVLVVGDDCLWCSNDSIGVGAIGQGVPSSVGGVVGGDKGGSSHSLDSGDDGVGSIGHGVSNSVGGSICGDNRGSSHSLHSGDDGLDSWDNGVDQSFQEWARVGGDRSHMSVWSMDSMNSANKQLGVGFRLSCSQHSKGENYEHFHDGVG